MCRRSQFHRSRVAFRSAVLLVGFVANPGIGRAQTPITRMSVDAAGTQALHESSAPAISADGRYVAFASLASNLVPGDTNGRWDIFVKERATGAIVRVSVSSSGKQGNGPCSTPAISSDGRFVAFTSFASNLVSGDTNGQPDVFVHDRDPDGNGVFDEGNGTTEQVSVDSNGVEGQWQSWNPSISADGKLVAFGSYATNLVAGDTNNRGDVFVHDRSNGTTIRVSVDSAGVEGNDSSDSPAISADGSCVAFESAASNLDPSDDDDTWDIFLHTIATGVTEWVSRAHTTQWSGGYGRPALSSDGSIVAFTSGSSSLVPGDQNGTVDVFVFDRPSGAMSIVSLDSAGGQGNGGSSGPSLSADGVVVAFISTANNLAPYDSNGFSDFFLHDRTSGATSALSLNCAGETGDNKSWNGEPPSLSADGRIGVYSSAAEDLVDDDTNGYVDVFAYDLGASWPQASWTSYGAGYAGTFGIPTFTAAADPEFGAAIALDISNSLQFWTVGFVLAGMDRASIPTRAGGTILVDWNVLFTVPLAPIGYTLDVTIPVDPALCGATADLQVIELDAGASAGLSFTAGLELAFGH
jgi:Tol biopolymer transport system component